MIHPLVLRTLLSWTSLNCYKRIRLWESCSTAKRMRKMPWRFGHEPRSYPACLAILSRWLTCLRSTDAPHDARINEPVFVWCSQGGDTWGCLQLRQEALALCKLYGPTGPYAGENRHPMLLSDAHFKLAKTYSILQCMPQAHDHCIK